MEEIEIEVIPSIYETNSKILRFVSKDFLKGIKLIEDKKAILLGN